MARIQHEFLTKQLGIKKLYAVMGPSAGGIISINWSVLYPEMVERLIGVITNSQTPVHTAFNVCQHAMRVIELDPKWNNGDYEDNDGPDEATRLACQLMNIGAYTSEYFEQTFKRDSSETDPYFDIKAKTSYEKQLYELIKNVSSVTVDASHWYYTSRATMLQDIAHDFHSLEEVLNRITAKVLMVSCTSDMLFPTVYNQQMVEILQNQGKDARLYKIESMKGHMAGVFDTHLFSNQVAEFLS